MSDEPTTIDWVLHRTRGHTPTENWYGRGTPVGFNITWHDTADQRWDEEEAHMAECNQLLVRNAPLLREEVIRLREENDLLRSMQRDGIEASAHDNLLSEINRLREDNEKLHDAINRSFHAKISGSALEIYNGWWEGEEE